MIFGPPELSMEALVQEIVQLLPEYLPGVETGPAASTEGRTCWIKTWKALLIALGRERGFHVALQEEGDSALSRQLTILWKTGDAVTLAAFSGFGDRQELERRFQQLESLKAPYKLILYSCLKWQDAVIEQLEAALLRYPHHLEGERYLALNLMGATRSLGVHLLEIPKTGALQLSDVKRLNHLPGSPFSWMRAYNRASRVSESPK
jgi:hypothetical protein